MDRHTYRYTPILSYLMIPNLWFYDFGKVLFCLIGILCTYYIDKILKLTGHPISPMILWLYNPLEINTSTRGNAESIVALMTILVLYNILKQNYKSSAVWFGLVVHFKIYPILYALPIYFFIDHKK